MLIATHSSIDCFRTCHKKYFYEYDQSLKPQLKSWALLDGEAFDAGLNMLYQPLGEAPSEIVPSCMESRARAVIKADIGQKWGIGEDISTVIDQIYEKGGRNEQEAYIHRETVKAMLQGYILAYPPDEFDSYTPQPQGEVPVLNTYMREGSFILKFKADALVRKDDKEHLFETKTTSASSIEQFLNNLRLDDQPTTYLYGFRRLGYPVISVIYNVVRKPKHRQGKSESAEGFIKRVREALLADAQLTVAGERKYYFREPIRKNPKELQEFEEETRQVTKDMEEYMPYKSPSRCSLMYGSECPYLPLCDGSSCRDAFRKKQALHEEYIDV